MTLAAEDLRALDDPFASDMNIIAIDAHGNHAAASTAAGKAYIFQTNAMSAFEVGLRQHVPLTQ